MHGYKRTNIFTILSNPFCDASPLLQGTAVTDVSMNKIRICADGLGVTDAFPSTENYDISIKFEYKRVFGSFGDSWASDSDY